VHFPDFATGPNFHIDLQFKCDGSSEAVLNAKRRPSSDPKVFAKVRVPGLEFVRRSLKLRRGDTMHVKMLRYLDKMFY